MRYVISFVITMLLFAGHSPVIAQSKPDTLYHIHVSKQKISGQKDSVLVYSVTHILIFDHPVHRAGELRLSNTNKSYDITDPLMVDAEYPQGKNGEASGHSHYRRSTADFIVHKPKNNILKVSGASGVTAVRLNLNKAAIKVVK